MGRILSSPAWFALPLVVLMAAGDSVARAQESRRPREIIRDFDAVHLPSLSKGNSAEAIAEFERAIRGGCARQAELALELYQVAPEHRRVAEMMWIRWSGMTNALDLGADVERETRGLLERPLSPALRRRALQCRARAVVLLESFDEAAKLAAIEAAIEADPKDEFGGVLLLEFVQEQVADAALARSLCERVVQGWPDSAWAGGPAKGYMRHLDRIGGPLPAELAFDDVLTGERIDDAGLRGAPVILQVWSSTPQERLAPDLEVLRRLRREHSTLRIVGVYNGRHPQGVKALAAELRERGIDWPHYYDETVFAKPWAGPWRVPRTPFYFLLDGAGTVRMLGSRPQLLEPALRSLTGPRGSEL